MDKSFNKIIKSQIKLMVLSVIAVVLVCASASYALFSTSHKNTTDQVISIGTIATGISGTPINLVDIYPMEESELTNDYPTYTFTITNANGTNNYNVNYELYLTDNTGTLLSGPDASSYSNYTALLTSEYQYINYKLDDNTASNLGAVYDSTTGKIIIKTGELLRNKSEEHTIRFWLSTSAPKSVQGKVLSLQMNMTSTPIKDVIYCVDENNNEITCPSSIETGTKIAIGRTNPQRFYVISNTSGTIRALAEYNLMVGNYCTSSSCTEMTQDGLTAGDYGADVINERIGLQSKYAIGFILNDENPSYGTVLYNNGILSTEAYSAYNLDGSITTIPANTGYTNYDNSIVKNYVSEYLNIMNGTNYANNLITKMELITMPELINLGCTTTALGGSDNVCTNSPYEWIMKTSYWSMSAYDETGVWSVFVSKHLVPDFGYYGYDNRGVRPVISISASSI